MDEADPYCVVSQGRADILGNTCWKGSASLAWCVHRGICGKHGCRQLLQALFTPGTPQCRAQMSILVLGWETQDGISGSLLAQGGTAEPQLTSLPDRKCKDVPVLVF